MIFYKTSDMDEGIVTGDDVSQTRLVWVRRKKTTKQGTLDSLGPLEGDRMLDTK